jgi:hypothetical protein
MVNTFVVKELLLVASLMFTLFFVVSGIVIIPLMYLWHFPMAIVVYVVITFLIFFYLTQKWSIQSKAIRLAWALLLTNIICYVFVVWHYKGVENATNVLSAPKIWGIRMNQQYHVKN